LVIYRDVELYVDRHANSCCMWVANPPTHHLLIALMFWSSTGRRRGGRWWNGL
jgi:hypothetical protein